MAHARQLAVAPALPAGAEIGFICDDRGFILAASAAIRGVVALRSDSAGAESLAQLAVDGDEELVRRGLEKARAYGISAFTVRLRGRDRPTVKAAISAWSVNAHGRNYTLCFVDSSPDRGRRAEECASRLADTQRVTATILELALQEIPLADLLQRTLDLILSIPWLSIERKGAIFLVEDDPRALVLKTNRGLNPALPVSCARVQFGTCVCGLAAAQREPVYAPNVDGRHATCYQGMSPHGHYCVPILHAGTVLGVITTYLAPGHERCDTELEFLVAVANTLAGVLIRRRADAERIRAERASRLKSEFLALVSHELLTPVTAVMLSCKRLERDRGTPLAPRQTEIVTRMEDALSRLASTIRMLLEHARLEAGDLGVHRKPVDLADLAERVVAEIRPVAERKGLTVRLDLETALPPLVTDGRLLRIVLVNLASNAVKFTERGWVAVRGGHRDGAHWLEVEDTGPGIPTREQARIFDRFEHLEPLANKHAHGMGLGLSLARSLASALGGRLDLDSAPGRGSIFRLTLHEDVASDVASRLN